MEINVFVDDRTAERLAVLLKAVNACADEMQREHWTLENVAYLAISNGIHSMEQTYANYIVVEASA